jgi:hypothetical protein
VNNEKFFAEYSYSNTRYDGVKDIFLSHEDADLISQPLLNI